jgi:hypothetical protein
MPFAKSPKCIADATDGRNNSPDAYQYTSGIICLEIRRIVLFPEGIPG